MTAVATVMRRAARGILRGESSPKTKVVTRNWLLDDRTPAPLLWRAVPKAGDAIASSVTADVAFVVREGQGRLVPTYLVADDGNTWALPVEPFSGQ